MTNRLLASFMLLLIATYAVTKGNELHPSTPPIKIILIAGAKSHGPGEHEYIKSVRLIKTMLDKSGLKQIKTELHFNGWPADETTLDDAQLILFITDGRDGALYSDVPFMTAERIEIMRKQMNRGCGLSLLHFSTFASNEYGPHLLEWAGGYFDWEDDNGKRNWYSAIKTLETEVGFPAPRSPVLNGVKPFRLKEEFYYNIRFSPNDKRLTPVLTVPALETNKPYGNVVAWTVQRKDGGRSFSTTMGHYFSNWQLPDYRKFMLNGIVWAAGAKVPKEGVEAPFYTDKEVTAHLYGKTKKALILTGNHHPAHPWKETTLRIKKAVERNENLMVDISTTIEDLAQYTLQDYDLLILNYCNWQDEKGLSEQGRKRFVEWLNEGGGLMIIHFANGAFHKSLPGAAASDWPEYRNICRRVWDHEANSQHDPYGKFTVHVTDVEHPVTENLTDFQTTDELYFNQAGNEPVVPLLTATSKITGKEEPLAWVYAYGRSKVFQTLLGHDAASFETEAIQKLLRQAAAWCTSKK